MTKKRGSLEFTSIRVGLIWYGWLFRDSVANDPVKFDKVMNILLINLKIILYHDFSLDIYEYLKHEYYHNQLGNRNISL